ncbi:MAG: diguanylate cyclase, partial [Clostridia bacterium]|nr:diguanylate cyclase [Clostridia bacterium]
CPFVTIFTSKDGRVGGEGYREFLLLRLDGENWESDSHVENKVEINRTGGFGGWNNWKEKNREGLDCRVSIQREGNTVAMTTENMGISLSSVTTVKDEVDELYVALTGDQCALTNIRIIKKD